MAKELPSYQRNDSIQPGTSTPDYSSAVNSYGQSTWGNLSSIGATVSQSAATETAKQMGFQMGQTPKGDLLPPITDFDKQVTESYTAQSSAQLSLQANKMMYDADTTMSQATRLTPELIGKTQQQMADGMTKILGLAPSSIKTQLGYTFGSQLQQQTHNYQLKMIGQQREDSANTMLAALRENSDTAFQLAASGNADAANAVIDQSKSIADAGVANRYFTKEQGYVSVKSIQDSATNARFIHGALAAKQNGNIEAWEKEFAKADPKSLGITYEQKLNAGNAVISYMGTLNTLSSQDENLRAAKMNTAIATDVNGITGSMLQELKDNVTPIKYEEVKLRYIDALKAANRSQAQGADLTASWSSPDAFARAGAKQKNASFDSLVDYSVQKSQTSGTPITKDDAEIQVAASAGGAIPAFVSSLNNKAASANPDYIEAAARQVHELRQMGAGHAVDGLSKEADALFTKYDSLRSALDPVTAARAATDIVYNQTPEQQQNNKVSWSNYMTSSTQGGVLPSEFALKQVGFKSSDFISPSMAHVYGTDILQTYNSYFQLLNGDRDSALKNTQRVVSENYGDTGINGGSHVTLHPLEKVLGYKDSSVTPFIQEDIKSFLNTRFQQGQLANEKSNMREHWEVLPHDTNDKALIFGHDYQPLQVQRVSKDINGKDIKEKFDVVVQGNAYNQWDLSVKSTSGLRPLFQVAPYLGVMTYIPNKKAIDAAYLAAHPLK